MWQTTVNELMALFREALIALTPVLRKAKLCDETGTGYDEWDEIVETLYLNIVIKAIHFHEGIGEGKNLTVPRYGLRYPQYDQKGFVGVHLKSGGNVFSNKPESFLVFLDLDTDNGSFDRARFVEIDTEGMPLSDADKTAPLEDVDFYFAYRKGNDFEILKKLNVL